MCGERFDALSSPIFLFLGALSIANFPTLLYHATPPRRSRLFLLQITKTIRTLAPGLVIPASLLESLLAGVATNASPAALGPAPAQAQSLDGAPATELPTLAATLASSDTFDEAMKERDFHDGTGFSELEREGAGEGGLIFSTHTHNAHGG